MKVLFVGQSPGGGGPGPVLGGRCGRKLAALAGISLDAFLRFDRINVEPEAVSCFRPTMARVRTLWASFERYDRVVIVGLATARGLRMDDPRPLQTVVAPARSLLVLPHPSGRNRWWNDPASQRAAERALRRFLNPDAILGRQPARSAPAA